MSAAENNRPSRQEPESSGPGSDQSQAKAPASQPAMPTPPKAKNPWLWDVVLLDDQEHTDTYVISMMQELFHLPADQAMLIAERVDAHGRTSVMTTHKELAELKRDQILQFGRDPQVATCKGSMRAVIEPAKE